MRKICVNFLSLVLQLLPPHKCQRIRVFILQCLVDLTSVYDSFDDWRAEQYRLLNMNSQVKVLESWLRRKIHSLIQIHSRRDGLLLISLIAEQQLTPIGFMNENPQELPLLIEMSDDWFTVDFIVIPPPGDVDMEALRVEIEKFKPMDKTYKIIVR